MSVYFTVRRKKKTKKKERKKDGLPDAGHEIWCLNSFKELYVHGNEERMKQ